MNRLRIMVIAFGLFALVSVCPSGSGLFAQETGEGIKAGEELTLDRCIGIALLKQPTIRAAFYTAEAGRSRVGEAMANYYPQIGAIAGYTRVAPVGVGNSFDQYTSSITLSQNIYDFGRTSSQVRIQKHNLDAARSDLETSNEQIVLGVKQAYYSVLQTARNRAVAEEAVGQFRQHLEQARGFFDVGTKPKFDVTKAEVDLSNAKLSLIAADNALKIARVNLNNAMGVPDAPDYTVRDTLDTFAFKRYELTLEDALSKAMANRPDIRSLAARSKAAEENIAFIKANYYPALTGSAAYNWSGSRFPLDDGWNAGVAVTVPVFSGFLTKYQLSEAEANLNTARANEAVLRQNVVLEVQQAYLNLRQAEESIATTELAVRQATENLDIANGRYAAGVGNPIEVTDAQVTYSNAKLAYIQALTNYNIAKASLTKAMGGR